MTTESIPLPAERVPPVATDMAGSSKSIAAVLFFFAVVFGFAAFGSNFEKSRETADKGAAHEAGRLIGSLLFAAVPGYIGFRFARNASRATRAAALAKSEPAYTWRLAGKWIVAGDPAGVPRPELSFKINGKLRTMLLAVPRAEVRES